MKLCIKTTDKKGYYVYSDYKLELLENWVKIQTKGDIIYFPVSKIEKVVEFTSKFQEALIP